MDVTQADAFNNARGYSDWTGTPAAKSAALIRAMDYISANYNMRPLLSVAEQSRLDTATYFLARDMLNNPSGSIRAQAAIVKESKEGAGFKKSTEYADAPIDPYPAVSVLLNTLTVSTEVASYAIGKLVR